MSTATSRFRSSSSTSSSQSATAPKKSLNLPSSDRFGVVCNAVLFFCRRIVFATPKFQLIFWSLVIIGGSILKEFQLASESYLPSKRNIFNIYFVKQGWGWSMALLTPFIYLTTMICTRGPYKLILRHFIRLLVATGVWFVITALFIRIEAITGTCNDYSKGKSPRHACLKGGYKWQEGHDISGHIFILLYALLIINEEVKVYDKVWKEVELNGAGDSPVILAQHPIKMFLMKVFYVALAALTVLWGCMLLSTALYFHTTWEKLAAAMLAVFFWFITYRVWYPMKNTSILIPCAPGEGLRVS